MKHTPGPWQTDLERSSGNNKYSVLDNDGWRVAWVDEKSDARLIAAAPDLLEALESMSIEFSRPDYELFCDHGVGICSCAALGMIEKAKETIKKARGL